MQSKADRIRQLLQAGELSPVEIGVVVGTTVATVRSVRQRMKRPQTIADMNARIESLRIEMRLLQRDVSAIRSDITDIFQKIRKTRR
jgi:hypothetical protein